MKQIKAIVLVSSIFLTATAWAQGPASKTGTFITIDGPGALQTYPKDMNNSGQIVGYFTDSSPIRHAFEWSPNGQLVVIDDPAAGTFIQPWTLQTGTYAFAINDAGAITGYYEDENGRGTGFLRSSKGLFTSFEPTDASPYYNDATDPTAINRTGMITGDYGDINGLAHNFVRQVDGTFTEFDVPGALTSGWYAGARAVDINASGMVIGFYYDANLAAHGFLRAADGTITPVDVPGAGIGPWEGTWPFRIDAAGTIVGGYTDLNGVPHGIVRTLDGNITFVDYAGAVGTGIADKNRKDELVGNYSDFNSVSHGFIRHSDGSMTELSHPNAGTSAGQGTTALRVNDKGQVAGYFIDANNVFHGFFWTPR